MMPGLELLPEEAAERAKELEFFARTRVQGFLKGENRSRFKGASTDFFQHRQYAPGDDLRALDWRVFARSDRLVTREYEEYTNLDVILGVDGSGSMAYPPGEPVTKIDFARRCAAMLAYLLNLQRDRYGLAVVSDKMLRFVAPRTGRKHLAEALKQLAAIAPAGETDLAACVRQLERRVRRKSVFVFFSDGYQDPDPFTRAIGGLQLSGHDVILYQVFDPVEADLPFAGFTLFRDLESGQVDSADAPQIREAYRTVFREHVRHLQDGCNRYGIEFHSIPVSSEWDKVFASLLMQRASRP